MSEIIVNEKDFINTYKLKKFGKNFIETNFVKFPIYSSKELAMIVSYITFDGHLSIRQGCFIFTAGCLNRLKYCENIIEKLFDIRGVYRKIPDNYGESYELRYFKKPLCRILKLVGVPNGKKVITKFRVPPWIMKNKDFSRAFLQIAFDCEGCIWKEGNTIKIRFGISKNKKLANNCKCFLNDLKNMLLCHFNIETTSIWSVNDSKTIKFCFQIRSKSFNNFHKHINFRIKSKKKRLDEYMGLPNKAGL